MTRKAENKRGYFALFAMIPAMAGMLLLAIPAHAAQNSGFFSGHYLRDLCESDEKGREKVKGGHTACQSYIAGVIDYHKLLKSLGTQPAIDLCVPNDVPMSRLQNIVFVYLAKNSQHTDFIAAPAVSLALYDYYPCDAVKKTKKRRR